MITKRPRCCLPEPKFEETKTQSTQNTHTKKKRKAIPFLAGAKTLINIHDVFFFLHRLEPILSLL